MHKAPSFVEGALSAPSVQVAGLPTRTRDNAAPTVGAHFAHRGAASQSSVRAYGDNHAEPTESLTNRCASVRSRRVSVGGEVVGVLESIFHQVH